MIIQDFLKYSSQEVVVFKYLEMLAERTVQLEQRLGLHELEKLRAENKELIKALSALQTPPLEQLLTFLPAIFVAFWSKISPAELTQLIGSPITPNLPTLVTSLDKEKLAEIKQQFLNLPTLEQAALSNFCRKIQKSHQLQWNAFMRHLFV